MIHVSVTAAVQDLTKKIRGLGAKRVYVGITDNVQNRLTTHKANGKYNVGKHCWIQCSTNKTADSVEKKLTTSGISGITIMGGTGGGGTNSVFVYAFSC